MYEYYQWLNTPGSPNFDEREDFEMNDKAIVLTEAQQHDWAALAVEQAKTFEVKTQQDYDNAAELIKDIKDRVKQIEEYWKDPKSTAYKTWQDICKKETDLLAPFTKAETDLKGKMAAFQKQKMEEERLLREEQERWKKAEADRLLEEAAQAEKEGNTEYSEGIVELAEQTQNMTFAAPVQHKTAGTSARKIWKARVVNENLVPVSFMGAVLRPVDLSALDKLAKASKGAMKIPGVEFYEDVQIRIR
jgi:hypothetical protein